LRRIEEEGWHSPVTFQRKIGKQRDKLTVWVGSDKSSPRACGHDGGILAHFGALQAGEIHEVVIRTQSPAFKSVLPAEVLGYSQCAVSVWHTGETY
jgi:hypothetical protein